MTDKQIKETITALQTANAIITEQLEKLSKLVNNTDDKKPTEEAKLSFKIKSVFNAEYRLDELEEIPKTPYGDIDYWEASKLLCEKDGGRLPTMKELAELASYIYGEEIEDFEDKYGLEVKRMPKELEGFELPIYLWSGEEDDSDCAYSRGFGSGSTVWDNSYRLYSGGLVVCLGD